MFKLNLLALFFFLLSSFAVIAEQKLFFRSCVGIISVKPHTVVLTLKQNTNPMLAFV